MPHPVEVVLALLAVAVALGVAARRLNVAYPILLVVGGLLLSLQSWTPPVAFDPQVVFLLFLPPLLYSGAFRTDWAAFRRQLRAITLLAVGLVVFTTAAVAAAAHYGLGLGWGPAFVLGALVSPPDAVAAMAVVQRLRVPPVVVTILEGESLINDASALVALRVAVGAVMAGTFSAADAGAQFVVSGVGGVALGLLGGWLVVGLHGWLGRHDLADSKLTITITLLTPFAVYLPAEHLHVSGVLAAVAAGLWVGNRCERVFSAELYEEARAVWEWVEFLLNSLIFILIGLLLKTVLDNLDHRRGPAELACCAAGISGVVILARLVWVFPGAYLPRWLDQKVLGVPAEYPPVRAVVVVGWAGMRGVVSLAAALALPEYTHLRDPDGRLVPFPDRALIQYLTFWVIFATLVGQGLTLPLLIRKLGVGSADLGAGVAHPYEPASRPAPNHSPVEEGPMRTLMACGLVAALVAVGTAAAEPKDGPLDPKKLVGTWEPAEAKKDMETRMEFTKDNKLVITTKSAGKEKKFDGTYKLAENKLTLSVKVEDKKPVDTEVVILRLNDDLMEMEDAKGKKVTMNRVKPSK